MGSIQEALKELKRQRTITESKTVRPSRGKRIKFLKEDLDEEAGFVDQDGDGEVLDFDLGEACKNGKCGVNEASNLGRLKYDGMVITYNKDEYSDPEEVKDVIDGLKSINTDEFKDAKSVSIANFDYYTINGKKYNVRDGFLTPVGMSPEKYAKARNVNECDQTLQEDAGFVDQDGDGEVLDFDLHAFFQENLNESADGEKVTVAAVKKDKNYSKLPDKVVNKLIEWAKQDEDVYTLDEFLNWIGGYNSLAECAVDKGNKLDATDFYALVEGDKKFEDVITKIAKKINWINNDGYYVDDDRKNAKKPTVKELTLDFIRLASPEDKDKEYTFKILKDAYINNDYSMLDKADLSKVFKKLHEDLQSSMPVRPLPEQEVIDFINNIPVARGIEKAEDGTVIAKARPTCFFKLGYFKEVPVAAKFAGGRGSEGNPFVRIFKAIEYNKLYTGADYENLGAVKDYRKNTGIERSGEKTGFSYQGEGATVNKIGTYPNGDKALQAYLANNCQSKTKYFLSLDDGDLQEVTRQEVAQYLTPANANKLLNPEARPKTRETSVNAESGEEIVVFNPQAVNRLKIKNIYMIGNLGQSII